MSREAEWIKIKNPRYWQSEGRGEPEVGVQIVCGNCEKC